MEGEKMEVGCQSRIGDQLQVECGGDALATTTACQLPTWKAASTTQKALGAGFRGIPTERSACKFQTLV